MSRQIIVDDGIENIEMKGLPNGLTYDYDTGVIFGTINVDSSEFKDGIKFYRIEIIGYDVENDKDIKKTIEIQVVEADPSATSSADENSSSTISNPDVVGADSEDSESEEKTDLKKSDG